MTAQSVPGAGTAQVIIRPPLLFIGAILLGFVMDHVVAIPIDVPRESELVHRLIPASLAIIGLLLAVAGIRNFMRSGTPVPTNQPARTLVTTDIHGWTRNPIYLGNTVALLGFAIGLRWGWLLLLLPVTVAAVNWLAISREEEHLRLRFSEEWKSYSSRVRRWL